MRDLYISLFTIVSHLPPLRSYANYMVCNFCFFEKFVLLLRDSLNLMNMTSFCGNARAMVYRLRVTSSRPSNKYEIAKLLLLLTSSQSLEFAALQCDRIIIVIDLIFIEIRFEIQLNSSNEYDLFALITMESIRRRKTIFSFDIIAPRAYE